MNHNIMILKYGLTLASMISSLGAQAYFTSIFPQNPGFRSARTMSLGMSGVAASAGIENVWTNPALLSTNEKRLSITAIGSLRRFEEKRSFPVMDMFDDVVTDNVYVANRYWYNNLEGGMVLKLRKNNYLGLSKSTFWDFTYDYAEEVRGSLPSGTYNRDPVRGYNEIHRGGQITAYSIGMSQTVFSQIKIGITANILKGESMVDRYAINVLEPDEALASDSSYTFSSDVSLAETTMMPTFGISYQPNRQYQIGFSYQKGVDLSFNNVWTIPKINERTQLPGFHHPSVWDSTGQVTISLPAKMSIGVEAKMKNPLKTKAVFELHYTDWSKYKLTTESTLDTSLTQSEMNFSFKEAWEIHGGIEHYFQEQIPFRFGFIFSESPLGQEFERIQITLGSAYVWGKATFDFGIIFGSLSYRYEDIFPAMADETIDLETVNESNSSVKFSIQYDF